MLFNGLRFHLSPACGGAERNRPVDGGPGSNNSGCIQIGVLGMPAGEAAERCLGRAVIGVNKSADTTLLARIRPVDDLHRNPRTSGLVLDEGSELMERPFMMSFALIVSNRGPLANACQIFQGDPPLRALCRANDPLADDVVGIGLKPALSSGDRSQFPLG